MATPPQLLTSTHDEWYTPPHIVQVAIDTMGAIDLDPCSPDPPVVPCSTFYTIKDDNGLLFYGNGLAYRWHGRVWLNPPYSEVGRWVAHLLVDYRAGRISEAVVLTAYRPDTRWSQTLDAFPRCHIRGRLRFSGSKNSATFPSVLFYLGDNVARFADATQHIGMVYVPYKKES